MFGELQIVSEGKMPQRDAAEQVGKVTYLKLQSWDFVLYVIILITNITIGKETCLRVLSSKITSIF